jgi:hypothetical protein
MRQPHVSQASHNVVGVVLEDSTSSLQTPGYCFTSRRSKPPPPERDTPPAPPHRERDTGPPTPLFRDEYTLTEKWQEHVE